MADYGNRSKYRSSSSSLPRSPTGLEPPAVPERKNAMSHSHRHSTSTLYVTDSDVDHKKTLQDLNTRLVSYVEKVRKLQMATDVIDSIPKQQGMDEQSLMAMKRNFELEISEWKTKLTDAQNFIAQMKIQIENVQQDNKKLNIKVNEKLDVLKERDAHIANLEAEFNELHSKLHILQNEKGKLLDNEAVYKSDISDLKKELDMSRRNYDKEKMKNAELENQLGSLDKDLQFKIQLLETELNEEKKRNKIDFNAIDRELKSDYENRLRSEMENLRRVYGEQTEKAKHEFMHLHSKKLAELQEQLSRERSNAMAGKSELTDWKSRVDQYKAIINQLETDKMMLQQQLQQQVSDLKSKLDEQGSTFKSQIKSKDNEVLILQKDINKLRSEYERLVEIKQALALEIEIYKNIIEGEEKRIRKVSKKFSRITSKSHYESFSDSEGEIKTFKGVDEIDNSSNQTKHQVFKAKKVETRY